ncbi:protein of unknown function [Jatrophihabitans endophyticus]|uniref:DUF4396 domain-containing protein n=1 Tax=Jatrophihabitans endophyticus TaxID=1206085 RepID=A0A1M5KJM0_9ACTN|nr:DUF4396 domain-containing protein [Jatrophihabitans endophyticus]SHG53022.1 protein of unknown function [Jatrophihabitans endophyticus]
MTAGHDEGPGGGSHAGHGGAGVSMAAAATLHCLTGCAIGEIVGMMISAGAGLGNAASIVVAVALSFVFGYTLSSLPLLAAGLPVRAVLGLVLAADTLSIATMEAVDNTVEAVVPGALNAMLSDAIFWWSLLLSLVVAYAAAFPVNRWLLARGKGHAITHGAGAGARPRRIPVPATATLAVGLVALLLGGWLGAAG